MFGEVLEIVRYLKSESYFLVFLANICTLFMYISNPMGVEEDVIQKALTYNLMYY